MSAITWLRTKLDSLPRRRKIREASGSGEEWEEARTRLRERIPLTDDPERKECARTLLDPAPRG
jgi:hypothetical protein